MEQSEIRSLFKLRKVCVLIPTYNNEQTLAKVITDVLQYTDQVIVVNDGSTDESSNILQNFRSIDKVEYSKNRGKGYALRTGFSRAVAKGYDYAISIDSDGQHFASDLPKFLKRMEEHPAAIILGVRNMEQSSVPGKSSFGNKFSNFWFWVTTGHTMKDTQSGYRLYPVSLMKDIRFFTVKFEFEIEVLVRSSWRGIDIEQVPVGVYYPEKGKRVTHFRPFKDITRITILNTFFVLYSVFYIKPRDVVRSLKKKTSGKSFANNSSILPNQTR
jgi:glycosyltransferase involved in cell wall biosynthesis